jgi:hypothetical protein
MTQYNSGANRMGSAMNAAGLSEGFQPQTSPALNAYRGQQQQMLQQQHQATQSRNQQMAAQPRPQPIYTDPASFQQPQNPYPNGVPQDLMQMIGAGNQLDSWMHNRAPGQQLDPSIAPAYNLFRQNRFGGAGWNPQTMQFTS